MIIAGDIGGTKTNLGLFSWPGGELQPVVVKSFNSRNYAGLEPLVREFLGDDLRKVTRACFGVPCPIEKGRCEAPNLPWVLSAGELQRNLQIPELFLINDLEATAYGIPALKKEEVVVLNEGNPVGNRHSALIAAGTGLGEAILFWNGERHVPAASEGGHADFAPRSPIEIELLQYLQVRFGHVSYERVVSGPGLFNIYRFLRDSGYGDEPEWLAERMSKEDPSSVISRAALAHESELCGKALELFASIYGAEAGNLALKAMAAGGIYVGGGIAPKIIEKLRDGAFMKAFMDKGRFSSFLASIPVKVILNEKTALYGAARYAAL